MEIMIEQILQQGITAHKQGKLNEAERLYKVIIQSQPMHPDANHNLGLIAVSVNKADVALPLFKTALEANPKIEQFWLSYIDALIKEKQFDNAKQVLQQAKIQGLDVDRLNSLEIQITSKTQKTNTARLSPPKELLDSLLENYKNGRFNDAEKLAISITQDFPKHKYAWFVLGAVLRATGRYSEAVDANKVVVKLSPQDAATHNNLGVTLMELGRLKEAEASYNQAIKLKPIYAEAHYNLGVTLKGLGRLDESLTSLNKAIELKSDYAEAHRTLTSIKKFDTQDEQYSKMYELYLSEEISEEQRCHINFGLAKAYEDLRNFEQAFTHYGKGNEIRKKLLNYDIKNDIELFRKIKSNNPQIAQNSLVSEKFPKNLIPIFIVGMPRSGTTLVEQIISSHSKVTGAGELPYVAQFGAAIASGFSQINYKALLDFRNNYLKKLRDVSNGNLIVTDKMPQNFRYIGLLAAVFPEAKIIHVKRNPAAVCWANYKQYFESKSIGYCYAIDDVISYYKLYQNLMEFWTNTLSNRIYKLDYEQLTVNQESETRQLIDYLDLYWDEKCLSPQNNTRGVATASNLQIRKEVYRGSSDQWKKYQPFLNGEFDDLPLS